MKSMKAGTVVKPKKRCCKDRPRCKRCPVVLKRLSQAGAAARRPDGAYVLTVEVRKPQLKAARAGR